MVDGQLRTNKVTDQAVLDVFSMFPREMFAPVPLQGTAYVDEDLDLGHGRVMIEPMIAARMLQAAEIQNGTRVLVIGGGNGSLAHMIQLLGGDVTVIEGVEALANQGRENVPGVSWIDQSMDVLPVGPFDLIITGGGVADIPAHWAEALTDGGRILAIVRGQHGNDGRVILAHKSSAGMDEVFLFNAAVPLMPEFERQSGFIL